MAQTGILTLKVRKAQYTPERMMTPKIAGQGKEAFVCWMETHPSKGHHLSIAYGHVCCCKPAEGFRTTITIERDGLHRHS